MNRTTVWTALLLMATLLSACSSMESMLGTGTASGPTSTLTQQLGVTESQAAGGTGAILVFAQQRLAAA